jgi:streptolysin S family bacteriocin protoxin
MLKAVEAATMLLATLFEGQAVLTLPSKEMTNTYRHPGLPCCCCRCCMLRVCFQIES